MSENGYIKMMRDAEELFENDIDSFLILTQMAFRARREDSKYSKNNIKTNQALIGDFDKLKISQQRYRDAKERIELKYKLGSFKGTNKGTIATFTNTAIYDINPKSENEQGTNKERTRNEQGTNQERTKERTDNDQENEQNTLEKQLEKNEQKNEQKNEPENIKRTTNKNGRIKNVNKKEDSFSLPLPKEEEGISFDFETCQFENISPDDISTWEKTYPDLKVQQEILSMQQWVDAAPSERTKKNWKKFITGWLGRNQKSISDKKATLTNENSRAILGGERLVEYDNAWK